MEEVKRRPERFNLYYVFEADRRECFLPEEQTEKIRQTLFPKSDAIQPNTSQVKNF